MSKDFLFKQNAQLQYVSWLFFFAVAVAVFAIAQTAAAQDLATQSMSEPTELKPSLLQVQSDTTVSGFAGGITSNDFIPLMDLIQSVIKTDSWLDSGGEGAIIDYPAGVYVDAASAISSAGSKLDLSHCSGSSFPSHSDISRNSKRRTISLNRIEQAITLATAAHRPVSEQLQNLAGIYRVDWVYLDARNADVLISGPAGPWRTDTSGRVVNIETGLPTLQLDDLMVCLVNAFADEGKFGCTIVPKPSALKTAQEFLAAQTTCQGRKWRESLRAAVGRQNVIVHGISPDSGVAETIVGADYLMKKIGMGLEPSIDPCPSYFNRLMDSPATSQDQTLIRWWFTMAYDAMVKDADDRCFQFSGHSIKVLSENELLDQQGQRIHTGQSDDATAGFAEDFSRHIEALSEKYPVFASLKNVFDLALVANIVKKYDVRNREHWELRFSKTSIDSRTHPPGRTQYILASHEYDTEVDSIMNFETVNFRQGAKRFRRTMVGVSGGVEFDSRRLFSQLKITEQSRSRFPQPFDTAGPDPLSATGAEQWWWD